MRYPVLKIPRLFSSTFTLEHIGTHKCEGDNMRFGAVDDHSDQWRQSPALPFDT